MAGNPNPKILCHRSSMMRSCQALVTSGRCERWKTLELRNPKTGVVHEVAACIDDHAFHMQQLQLIKTDEVNGSVDELRKEAHAREQNGYQASAAALGAIAHVIERVEAAAQQPVALPPSDEQLSIEFKQTA